MLIPDWFDRTYLRQAVTAGQLNKLMLVDGIYVSSWLARREKQNRPVPRQWRIGTPIVSLKLWRPLDVIAAARADNVAITPTSDHAVQLTLGEMVSEINRLTQVRDTLQKEILNAEVMHRVQSIAGLQASSKRRLVSRQEIIAAAAPFTVPSGVYFLLQDDEIVYVGQSVDIVSRIQNHHSKSFNKVAWVAVGECFLDIVESLYIHALSPTLNKSVPLSIEELFLVTDIPRKSKTRSETA